MITRKGNIGKMNKKLILFASVVCIGYWEIKRYKKNKKDSERRSEISRKDNGIMETLMQWVQVEHENKSISELLIEMKYKSIGIYGYGYLGTQLERVLSDGKVEITCVIDKKIETRRNGERIFRPDEILPAMDVIVVTSPFYYAEIKDELEKLKVQADIISIDALIYQL